MAATVAIVALMIYAFLLAAPLGNSELHGFRATMVRRKKSIDFMQASLQSYERLSKLAARLHAATGNMSTETTLRADSAGSYDMEFSIGTPPQSLSAQADTGSDLVWVKCGPCASCTPPGSPSFDPTNSSSFYKLPCSDPLCRGLKSQSKAKCGAGGTECEYRYSYGVTADHYTEGYMGIDTFTIGSDAVPGVGFGCTTRSEGNYGTGSGLVGLGRGPLSLVSQMGVSAFSYCLVHDFSMASPLLFGTMANLTGTGVQSTPLVNSTTSLYAVTLKNISIGSATIPGSATDAVVFDSGTTLTFLAEPAYTAAKEAILSGTSLPRAADRHGLEACFEVTDNDDVGGAVPSMVLHFDGADMELPAANYFEEVERGVVCWAVRRSSSLSIIGNVMQMNYHIRYDLDKMVMSFQQANCSGL